MRCEFEVVLLDNEIGLWESLMGLKGCKELI
jgi:hypothetical protein